MSVTLVPEAVRTHPETAQSSRAGPKDAWALLLSSLMAAAYQPPPAASIQLKVATNGQPPSATGIQPKLTTSGQPAPATSIQPKVVSSGQPTPATGVTPAAKLATSGLSLGVIGTEVPKPMRTAQAASPPTGPGSPVPEAVKGAGSATGLSLKSPTEVAAAGVHGPPPKTVGQGPEPLPGTPSNPAVVLVSSTGRPATAGGPVGPPVAVIAPGSVRITSSVGVTKQSTVGSSPAAGPVQPPTPLVAAVGRGVGGPPANVVPPSVGTKRASATPSVASATTDVAKPISGSGSGPPANQGPAVPPLGAAPGGVTGQSSAPSHPPNSGQVRPPVVTGHSEPVTVVAAKTVTEAKHPGAVVSQGSSANAPTVTNHLTVGVGTPDLSRVPLAAGLPLATRGPAATPSVPTAPAPSALPPRIWHQIQTQLQRLDPGSSVQISLDPPNLGHLTVHLLQRGDHLTAKLVVSHPEAGSALNQGLGELKAALAKSGISGAAISVLVQGDGSGSQDPWQPPTQTPRGLAGWTDEVGSGDYSQVEDSLNYLV